jgi:ubiquinone/menaquinone biosynthesis C-methylase UbiE
MIDSAEENVARFYRTAGWQQDQGITEDARRWEDLRSNAHEYVGKCRLRILRHLPARGDAILDMASGPIQYPEYLLFSKGFTKRFCVDLSPAALEEAERKIGGHGVFVLGSFFDLAFEDNFFDCSMSLHTIYHMDKDRQEEAVRKLLRITKPNHPVVIVYSNPNTLLALLKACFSFARKRRKSVETNDGDALYFHAHELRWWQRFADQATVEIYPWRALAANAMKTFIPDNILGKWMLGVVFRLEEAFPNFFVKHFQYPLIVLTKK